MIHTFLMKSRGFFTVSKPAKQIMQADPVCGMSVDVVKAFVRNHDGKMNYFCCPECKKESESMIKSRVNGVRTGFAGNGLQRECVAGGL